VEAEVVVQAHLLVEAMVVAERLLGNASLLLIQIRWI
jgi:hypothetical protein